MINKKMIAFCGTYCGVCEWKDKIGCKGCKDNRGIMFWGKCDKAICCIEKGLEHCGECSDMPCQTSETCLMIQSMVITEQDFAT